VFNGTDRLGSKSPEPQATVFVPGRRYPTTTQSERDHIPIVPPSPTRLLARIGPLSGERLGLELLVALLLGIPALIAGVLADRRAAVGITERDSQKAPQSSSSTGGPSPAAGAEPTIVPSALVTADSGPRIRRAVAAGLIVWTLTGIVLFSHMIRLHPRYVEGFMPAVAAMLGIGVAWAGTIAGRRSSELRSGDGSLEDRVRLLALTVALVATVYYVEQLLFGRSGVWWITLAAALGAIALAVLMRLGPRGPGCSRTALLGGATIALTLVAVLALPLSADITAIENDVTDAGYVGALPGQEQHLLSSYLRDHQGTARYEVATESATAIGSLIVQDARPVLILTTYDARVFTNVAELQRRIALGEVKYAFLNTFCGARASFSSDNAACSEPARWIRAHGTDVSRQAGLSRSGILWLLPGVKP
jgi:hypothetical protein